MTLWRISNYQDLKGIGGLKVPGRWHSRGLPVVYLSEHPALAQLEVMVHLEVDVEDLPETFNLLKVTIKVFETAVSAVDLNAFPDDWKDNQRSTRSIGDDWLKSESSLLLKVPNAIMPESYNYLFNPHHPDAGRAEVSDCIEYPFDRRLK